MELDVVPVSVYERWKSFLGLRAPSMCDYIIRDLRIVKSPFEIEQVKGSGACVTMSLKGRMMWFMRAREVDIAAFLKLKVAGLVIRVS